MVIPYSKEINLAFDQVTPLVAAGFKVLQTTKNITFLLAAIQVLTTVFLGLILITLFALIITVSPDLEDERRTLVTPVMRWLANSVVQYAMLLQVGLLSITAGAVIGAAGWWYVTREFDEEFEIQVEGSGLEIEADAGD